jgi:hypothetical protein
MQIGGSAIRAGQYANDISQLLSQRHASAKLVRSLCSLLDKQSMGTGNPELDSISGSTVKATVAPEPLAAIGQTVAYACQAC